MNKKCNSEEERRETRREYLRKYREANKTKIAEQQRAWREAHPDYGRKWREANKDKIAEKQRAYYEANKAAIAEYQREYYQANKDKIAEYRETPMGRAVNLVSSYKREDAKYNRGDCTLTAQWIVDNIFNSTCHYCGESDWKLLGCDRIDNSLPHTPENVVPCCMDCNRKRHTKDFEVFKTEMSIA